MSFAQRIGKMDPRWIWLIGGVIVLASVLAPVAVPVKLTSSTQQVVDWINGLPKGSTLLVAPEYEPGPDLELSPQLRAVAILAFEHGLRIVSFDSGWPLGAQLAQEQLQAAADVVGGKQYGIDWVNVGYKPGGATSENEAVQNFAAATAGVDYFGKPLASYPLTKGITALNAKTFSGIWVEETGGPGCISWYQNAALPAKVPLACGAVTGMFPTEQPYVTAGQYRGVLNGARGAAELEEIVHHPGLGQASQETAVLVSILILVLVALGNYSYYTLRKAKGA
jgi:hypothetical protein